MTRRTAKTFVRGDRVERQLDAMADDGTLGAVAKHMAIDAGADWPSLDGDSQDAWYEAAIAAERKRLSAAPSCRIRKRSVTK